MNESVLKVLRRYGILFALMSLIGLCTAGAFGQAIDGNIVGTVIDSQGAALAGAEISATSMSTNASLVTKSGATGEYRFDHLLAGTYRITVKVTGFKSVAEMVEIELNKTVTRNITLPPGAVSETIEVSGIPPVLDTTTAQLQNTYQTKQLEDLPTVSAGSGVINLALLDAGVATSGGIGLGTGPSVSGQRPRNNNFTVEGVDNNNKSVTGPLHLGSSLRGNAGDPPACSAANEPAEQNFRHQPPPCIFLCSVASGD